MQGYFAACWALNRLWCYSPFTPITAQQPTKSIEETALAFMNQSYSPEITLESDVIASITLQVQYSSNSYNVALS